MFLFDIIAATLTQQEEKKRVVDNLISPPHLFSLALWPVLGLTYMISTSL